MAGREKKTKNLSNARESPVSTKQTTLLNFISTGGAGAGGANAVGEAGETTDAPATSPQRKGQASKPPVKAIKKKINPNTKINMLRGRSKTKANFKLNIIKSQSKQIIKPTLKRGRPPVKRELKMDGVEKPEEEETITTSPDDSGKKRGRKGRPTNETLEETKQESVDSAKPANTKDNENKKTVVKNVPKKVVKKKQLIVAQKGLTKKKVLLAKQILKTDTKQVDPKVLKKNLTAKLKSVAEKLEVKKDAPEKESSKQSPTGVVEMVIPISEIKKEPDLLDVPTTVPNSRSASPRTGNLRRRNNADVSITKYALNDSSSVSAGVKSPYSTRSERSRSPFPVATEQMDKLLRNGKQRKPKGLKNTLLSETVGQEFKKRRRLLSDTKVGDLSVDSLDEIKKVKRLRSYSRDGSEISKCSDITESDLSIFDTSSVDADNNKTLEIKDDKQIKTQGIKIDNIKTERISIDTSPNVTSKSMNSSTETLKSVESAPLLIPVDTLPNKRDSMDNENNNTDEKIKASGIFVNDKINKVDVGNSVDEASKVSQNEKNAEKCLILDNMSKTFNESAIPNITKNIRRSARQRKSTVKAKEHEESILAEKDTVDLDVLTDKIKIDSPDTLTMDESEKVTDGEKLSEGLESPVIETMIKITTKTFYGESVHVDNSVVKKPPENVDSVPEAVIEPSKDTLNNENTKLTENNEVQKLTETPVASEAVIDNADDIRLNFDEDDDEENGGPVDDSLKENIQSGYTIKPFSHHDIDKLIDKLRNFEEQDKRRQEEKSIGAEKVSVMVTNDVVLIPKSNMDHKALKDIPNAVTLEKAKEKENILSCFENNSAISIVKKNEVRKSFDIELPSSVTLIKKSGNNSRKSSIGSNSKDGDSVTMIDKALGKEMSLELRKSIDKGILSLETSPASMKTSTITTGNGQSLSISLKPQSVPTVAKDSVVMIPVSSVTPQPSVAPSNTNPVTALISLPTPNPLLATPIPVTNALTTFVPIQTVVPAVSKIIDVQTQLDIIPLVPCIPPITEVPAVVDSVVPGITPDVLVSEPPKANIAVMPVLTVSPETPVVLIENKTKIDPPMLDTTLDIDLNKSAVISTETAPTVEVENDCAVVTKSDTKETISEAPLDENKSSLSLIATPLVESPEKQKQKEKILRTLGLLTLKEADEAKLEKQKQKEMLIKSSKSNMPKTLDGYTGTLKTVIRINRTSPDKKKSRSPLKMTFQKSKSRASKGAPDGISADSESDENPYYTIHKEFGGSNYGSGSTEMNVSSGGHRKTHYSNRLNIHDTPASDPLADTVPESAPAGKEATLNLVIPEKASSFGIHPGRLCQDQCFYCGGKFGLFDTPCHVAQIKSSERQKKILDNEEKLTVDSCLCDACYRHVDRRANCPGYRRRAAGGMGGVAALGLRGTGLGTATASAQGSVCYVKACARPALQSLRRKWLVKIRSSISKVVDIELDQPAHHTIPLCDLHYQDILRLMICGLCKRGLSKNHVHYINQEYQSLNEHLGQMGLPVMFKEKPVVCKPCRYFCTLLLRPPSQHQLNKKGFLKSYRRRLMQAHNLEVPEESDEEVKEETVVIEVNKEQSEIVKDKKKGKNGKSKNKKSGEIRKSTDENRSMDNTSPSTNGSGVTQDQENKKEEGSGHWKNQKSDQDVPKTMLEEDIESLISTNTIPIPNSNPSKATGQMDASGRPVSEMSDNSDLDMMDYDNPMLTALDKQSELQFLLQKCNIPSSTILQKGPISNLTQKSRNILRVHNATAISKNTQNQKILDKNARRIQKLGQIITKNSDLEKAICSRLPNREEFTLEAADKAGIKDNTGISILKNIALNDECTIESIPTKSSTKGSLDSLKSKKWQLSNSFSQIKKNLKALSNRNPEESKKKNSDQAESKYSNPVRRLETNPSISVRELFPGEEEMNLQCAIEFGNVKTVTPEGWEKCNTTIQYDSDTKKLWHELQKPYGNQSSFLRHLILLEKYFRNGDLILAQNANCNAVTYSESVQNRLKSYDNIPSNGEPIQLPPHLLSKNSAVSVVPHTVSPPPTVPSETIIESVKSSQTSSLIDFRKQKTNHVSGKSLLKTNQTVGVDQFMHLKNQSIVRPLESILPPSINHAKIPKNVPISIAQINQGLDHGFNTPRANKTLPASLSQLEKLSNQLPPAPPVSTPRPSTPRPEFAKPSNDFMKPPSLPPIVNPEVKITVPKSELSVNKPKSSSVPPELIAINLQSQRKSIENVLKNIQLLAKGASTPTSQSMSTPAVQTPGLSPITPVTAAGPPLPPRLEEPPTAAPAEPTKKVKGSSKQWRPTLIPITDESKLNSTCDVLYQTADGRRLPSLVQVMSGGKPYHITIQDYNRMCIIRREKLQQIQKAELNKKPQSKPQEPSPYDFTVDLPVVTTTPLSFKPPSPSTTVTATENDTTTVQSKMSDQTSTKTTTKQDTSLGVSPDGSAASLLKNVSLKNITIAPLSSKITSASVSPVSIPSIISQLGPSISVMAESVSKASAIPQSIAITSQAMLLPKIPKSLTVIPQTVMGIQPPLPSAPDP